MEISHIVAPIPSPNINEVSTAPSIVFGGRSDIVKFTPSTSTKKKLNTTSCARYIDEECGFDSPSSDSVFDYTETVRHVGQMGTERNRVVNSSENNGSDSSDVAMHEVESRDHNMSKKLKAEPKKSYKSVSTCSTTGSAVCRICHGSEKSSVIRGEPLIFACQCCGTMGLFHRSCLETWLSLSNRTMCEICKFQYVTERLPRRWYEYIRNPGNAMLRRNVIGDTVCFLVLTPLTLASSWLCVLGAVSYVNQERDTVEIPGLFCLAIFLVVTYFIWLMVTVRYHYKVMKEWQQEHQIVRVLDMSEIKKRNGRRQDKMKRIRQNNSPTGAHNNIAEAVV